MAYSYVTYTGDGSTTHFSVPFNYIAKADVTVLVDGVSKTFSWVDTGTVAATAAPASGTTVKVKRTTSEVPESVFSDGSVLNAADINVNQTQAIYLTQEALDAANDALALLGILSASSYTGSTRVITDATGGVSISALTRYVIVRQDTATDVLIHLPAKTSIVPGYALTVIDDLGVSGTHPISVASSDALFRNDAAQYTIAADYDSVTFLWNGFTWSAY